MADISKWNGLNLKDKKAREDIGNRLLLQTEDKTSLVNAINELIARIVVLEENGEVVTPTILLDLNRTQTTDYTYGWKNENCYLNPAEYGSTNNSGGNACTISNLTSNSITVTEGGTGGQGVAFPFIPEFGKSYTLMWNATGTTDTRFRYMMSDGGAVKYVDLDNKSGAETSATIVVSEDGKTVTVNGTSNTFTNPISWTAFHFSAGTGKTVSYTGVNLVEAT